jgi:hypothetical protein
MEENKHRYPRVRKFADDRSLTLEEIQKITEYPDRRIKAMFVPWLLEEFVLEHGIF